jgi:hypothetical protein
VSAGNEIKTSYREGLAHGSPVMPNNREKFAEDTPPPVQQVVGWQTMDTAEKTGKRNILLALPNRTVHEGYWGAGPYDRKLRDYVFGWVLSPNSGLVNTTAWMPMPVHPSTAIPEKQP